MKFYIAKPFQAVQILPETVRHAIEILPENFVFYGLKTENGIEEKDYDDLVIDKHQKVGGFLYFNKKTIKIFNSDWVIKRKDIYEIVNDDYFKANFIEIPIDLK